MSISQQNRTKKIIWIFDEWKFLTYFNNEFWKLLFLYQSYFDCSKMCDKIVRIGWKMNDISMISSFYPSWLTAT